MPWGAIIVLVLTLVMVHAMYDMLASESEGDDEWTPPPTSASAQRPPQCVKWPAWKIAKFKAKEAQGEKQGKQD